MIISLLLRSTLLLLVAHHSIAQEWYTQDNYGPVYYGPSMVEDLPPTFVKKRQAESSANESKSVYLSDYYASNVRQKRDSDDADAEQHSSDVTEYTTNDVTGHVDDLSEENDQSIDPDSSLEMNARSPTNDTYEYAPSPSNNSYEYTHSDSNNTYEIVDSNQETEMLNDTVTAGIKGNETSGVTSDVMVKGPAAKSRKDERMDEKEEPTDDSAEKVETNNDDNAAVEESSGQSYYTETVEDSSGKSYYTENDHVENKVENKRRDESNKSDQSNDEGKEPKERKTTSTSASQGEDGSGRVSKEEEDEWLRSDDEDKDDNDQLVKRQNLGTKIFREVNRIVSTLAAVE